MAFDVSLYDQAALFVYALIIGVFIGAVYDVFRIIRIALTGGESCSSGACFEPVEKLISRLSGRDQENSGKAQRTLGKRLALAVTFVCDILFFLITAVIGAVFLYQANYGQLRLYVVVAAVIGFTVYYNTVGRMITLVAGLVISLFRLFFAFLTYRLVAPVLKATQKAVSAPVEAVVLRVIAARSDAFEKEIGELSKNWFEYFKEVKKKEDGYEIRCNGKNCSGNSGFILHRKNRQPQNRIFGSEGSAGNDSRKNRLLLRRGRRA